MLRNIINILKSNSIQQVAKPAMKLLATSIGIGTTHALVQDLVRDYKIQQVVAKKAVLTGAPPEENKIAQTTYKLVAEHGPTKSYPLFSKNTDSNRHQLTVIKSTTEQHPYSVDSILGNKSLLVLPYSRKQFNTTIAYHGYLEAVSAHEAAHWIGWDSLKKDFFGLTAAAFITQAMYHAGKRFPLAAFMGYITYHATNQVASRSCEFKADQVSASSSANIHQNLIFTLKNQQKNDPTSITDKICHTFMGTHPTFTDRINSLQNQKPRNFFNSYLEDNLSASITLRRKLLNLGYTAENVKPTVLYQNPFMRSYDEKKLLLTDKENDLIQKNKESASIFIDEKNKDTLHHFYEEMCQCNTPIGNLYKTLSFDDFIRRLATNRYGTAYLDGRMLKARQADDSLGQLLNDFSSSSEENKRILSMVGTDKDTKHIYKSYLSLEEIAVSGLTLLQAVMLPIGDGRRETEYLDQGHTWDISNSLAKAIESPIVISAPAGIECRDGATLNYDLFMVARPAEPTQTWQQTTETIRQSTFYKVSNMIYGNKLAIDTQTNISNDNDFTTIQSRTGDDWYLCKPAYKEKTKKTLRTMFLAADKQMKDNNLGTSYNLKGLGLGYFGFASASGILEDLFDQALQETLAEVSLKHIKQINLINWPSMVNTEDDLEKMQNSAKMNYYTSVNGIKLTRGLMNPLAKNVPGGGHVGGTHVCGDSASIFGNEFHSRVAPSSSDEAAMAHQLLNPLDLVAAYNNSIVKKGIIYLDTSATTKEHEQEQQNHSSSTYCKS